MQKIVFYKRLSDIDGMEGEILSTCITPDDRIDMIERFGRKEFETLLVSFSLITGWRCRLDQDEVDISFVGDGWNEEELFQGRLRVRRNPEVEPGDAANEEPGIGL